MNRIIATLIVSSLIAPALALADEDPDYLTGPWHYKAMSCTDTHVTSVTPRLGEAGQTKFTAQDFQNSGVIVNFATGLGMQPLFAHEFASVEHYQGDKTNATMIAERKGDSVQVCYLGGPAPDSNCNPDKDDRGRKFRVWDYRQHKQYWGYNSEHLCGGA